MPLQIAKYIISNQENAHSFARCFLVWSIQCPTLQAYNTELQNLRNNERVFKFEQRKGVGLEQPLLSNKEKEDSNN